MGHDLFIDSYLEMATEYPNMTCLRVRALVCVHYIIAAATAVGVVAVAAAAAAAVAAAAAAIVAASVSASAAAAAAACIAAFMNYM